MLRGQTYWIRYTENGRQIRKSTGLKVGHPGAVEAAKALRAKLVQQAFDRQFFPGRVDCSLGDAVRHYLKTLEGSASLQNRTTQLDFALEFFGEDTPVTALEYMGRIDEWRRHLERTRGPHGMRSSGTVRNYLKALKACLRAARKAKMTSANPFESVEMPPKEESRDRTATDEEIERLIETARKTGRHEMADMIRLGVETGLRLKKIFRMEWRHIDLEARFYAVPPTPGGKPTPKKAPLTAAAVEVLRSREGRSHNGGFLFSQNRQAPAVSKEFARLAKEAGIEGLRFHDFRHTAATRLRRAGVDILTIKAILGHKSLDVHQIYHSFDDEDLLAAVDKL